MSYTLIIAEKPSAAKRIAEALAKGKVFIKKKRGIYYYIFYRKEKKHVVVPAVGHLYKLSPKNKGWTYPIFDLEWVESYKVDKKSIYSKKYLLNIKDLAQADEYIIATDFDVEGRVIAYNILRFACNSNKARSMKFSTLTKVDLDEAYENASFNLELGMINSGITRHFLDFFYGVNITRALTLALNKKAKLGFQILSAGRVQIPALNILLEKEMKIREFKPISYWQIVLFAEIYGEEFTALHKEDKFLDKKKAENIVSRCSTKIAKVSNIQRKSYIQKPPTPFNLTDLQTEAYRFFGYTPDQSYVIAQSLYSEGWISYPRTSSQEISEKIGYRKIIYELSKFKEYHELCNELLHEKLLIPRQGKMKDPAHTAIYPTHQTPKRKLKGSRGKIYDLICRRFLAVFAKPTVIDMLIVNIQVNQEIFQAKGISIIEKNWHRFYWPYIKFEEKHLPFMEEGNELIIKKITLLDKQTNPPSRYTYASLLKKLEEKGLGTKATRTQIVQTLYDREYVRGKKLEVTKLGETVIHILNDYCPKIVSVELTREAEKKMNMIRRGKIEKEIVIHEARRILTDILKVFKEREDELGERLAISFKIAKKADSTLGKCPECGNELRVIYSKKTHLRFVGCEGYFKGVCNFSGSIPQEGRILSIDNECKYCGYPVVPISKKGSKLTWSLCLNRKCPNKKKHV